MAIAKQKIGNQGEPALKSTIRSLHVFSSGSAEQHREHRYGTWMPQLWWILTSRSWIKVPINFFLIEHRDGNVLFDTGLDPSIKTNPQYISSALGRFLLHKIFRLNISADDQLDRLLVAKNFSSHDIRTAVLSHLHFDHVGGIAQIPQARLMVSAREWAQLSAPHPEREWILREHIEIPNATWHPIEFQPTSYPLFEQFKGIYDVAGDGSMILLPTPGHTPGSLSMLVRTDGWAPILLVGDLTYEAKLLMEDSVPGTGDAKELRASYANVRALKEQLPDLVIIPSHDHGAAKLLQQAQSGRNSS